MVGGGSPANRSACYGMIGLPRRSEPWKQRAGSYPTREGFTTEHLCLILLATRGYSGEGVAPDRGHGLCRYVVGRKWVREVSMAGGMAEPEARAVSIFHH